MAKAKASVALRKRAKQDELPGVEPSERRIPELEDLGDELADWEDKLAEVKHRRQDAEDSLISAMKRHEKAYYSRQTWGSIILKQAAEKAKVKKAGVVSVNIDTEGEGDAEE